MFPPLSVSLLPSSIVLARLRFCHSLWPTVAPCSWQAATSHIEEQGALETLWTPGASNKPGSKLCPTRDDLGNLEATGETTGINGSPSEEMKPPDTHHDEGVADPQRGPTVGALWDLDGLAVYRHHHGGCFAHCTSGRERAAFSMDGAWGCPPITPSTSWLNSK